MGTLKEALEKAGLKASKSSVKSRKQPKLKKNFKSRSVNNPPPSPAPRLSQAQTAKTQNKQQAVAPRVHDHQQQHTNCEACKKTLPDIEYYEHNVKNLSVKWLCCPCADRYQVSDECRQTRQSDTSRRGLFRREYGATKRYWPEERSRMRRRNNQFRKYS